MNQCAQVLKQDVYQTSNQSSLGINTGLYSEVPVV